MNSQTSLPHGQSTTSTGLAIRIAVISVSVREGRFGPTVTDWVVDTLKNVNVATIDLIDLAHIDLPDDALLYPGGGPKTEVSDRIQAADAFVFITPEYNHSYPASVKRLIDWHYSEWKFKPATIIAYGNNGGFAAIEHLRGVLAELSMVTTRRCVGLVAPWNRLDGAGTFDASTGSRDANTLQGAFDELFWWTDVLADARTHHPYSG